MKLKQVKALLVASALASSTVAMAGCGKQETGEVSVSAEAEQPAAYFFTTQDLEGYITGLEDRTALMGTDAYGWFSGIQADKSIVQAVTVEASAVDAEASGSYDIDYIVTVDAEALQEALDEKEAAEESGEETAESTAEETDTADKSSEEDTADASAESSTDTGTSGSTDTSADTAGADGTTEETEDDAGNTSAEDSDIVLEDITAVVDLTGSRDGSSSVSVVDSGSLSVLSAGAEASDFTPYDITFSRTVTVVDEEQAAELDGEGTYVEGYSTGEYPVETGDTADGDTTDGNTADGTDSTAASDGSSGTGSTSSGSTGSDSSSSESRSSSSAGSAKSSGSSSSKSSSSGSTEKTSSSSSRSSGSTSSSGSSGSSSSSSSSSSHTHNWVAQYKTVHHDAETTQKWVEDTPAYEEYVCNQCGTTFGTDNEAAGIHVALTDGCSGYSLKYHSATGHYETVTTKAAYDEKVLSGYKCSGCGATK